VLQAYAIRACFNPPSPGHNIYTRMAWQLLTSLASYDGNKRTGLLVGVLFLELNGCLFTANDESAAQAILGLAAGTLDESALAAWLRAKGSGS
jgi:prophage maintenance system killer protein